MKKILCIALLFPLITFSQETASKEAVKREATVSLNVNLSNPSQFGISGELQILKEKDGRNRSWVFNLSGAAMKIDVGSSPDFTGTGFVIESGSRTYLKKESWNSWYVENFLSYGSIKFDETIVPGLQYEGTYSYFSMINPNVGYKINFGQFSLDPSIGFNWKWEFKGQGDVDNKYVDNFVPRVGMKLGYRF